MSLIVAFLIGAVAGLLSLVLAACGLLWLSSRPGRRPRDATDTATIPNAPAARVEIATDDVPRELQGAIAAARKFGVGCDGMRGELVERASADERAELVAVMRRHFWTLQKWFDFTRPPAETPPWLTPMMYARDAAALVTADLSPPRPPRTDSGAEAQS